MLVLGNCDARISLMYKNAVNRDENPPAPVKEVSKANLEKLIADESRKDFLSFLFSHQLQLSIK